MVDMKTRQLFCLAGMLFCMLFSSLSMGFAQDEEGETEGFWTKFTNAFDGYLDNETATRVNKLDYVTMIKNSLRLKYEANFADHYNLVLDTLSVYDAAYDVNKELAFPDDSDYRAYFQLREGTFNMFFDKFDLRLGRQQVVWEVTDGLRVLDIVNPLDLRYFILKDFDLIRIPLWTANFEFYFNPDYSLQALIIPDLTFTEAANPGSEWAFNQPPPPPGVQEVILNETQTPDVSFENTKYGLRFKGLLKGWDFTLNYLYTWNNNPIQKRIFDPATGTLIVTPEHDRLHMIGGSLVNVFWDTVFRAEVSFRIGEYFEVDDLTVADMVVQKNAFEYIIAFERDILSITWIAQGVQRMILDYEDIMIDDQAYTALTLRGSKFLNDEETFELAALGMFRIPANDYLIRPYAEYMITDSWRLRGGFDFFDGGDGYTFFGQFSTKDRVYAELRYSF